MRVIEVLRKLGILRYGAVKGTYHSTKDMPDELAFDRVYDPDADQLHRSDLRRAPRAGAQEDRAPGEPPTGETATT